MQQSPDKYSQLLKGDTNNTDGTWDFICVVVMFKAIPTKHETVQTMQRNSVNSVQSPLKTHSCGVTLHCGMRQEIQIFKKANSYDDI